MQSLAKKTNRMSFCTLGRGHITRSLNPVYFILNSQSESPENYIITIGLNNVNDREFKTEIKER